MPSATAHKKVDSLDSFLTTTQVAELYGCTEPNILTKVARGRLHPIMAKHPVHGRRLYLFSPYEVEEELKRLQILRSTRIGDERFTKKGPKSIQDLAAVIVTNKKLNKRVRENQSKNKDDLPVPQKNFPTQAALQLQSRLNIGHSGNGKEAAQAVRLFAQGKTPLDVLQELEIDFGTVKEYWKSYVELKGVGPLSNTPPAVKNNGSDGAREPEPDAPPSLTPEEEAALLTADKDE